MQQIYTPQISDMTIRNHPGLEALNFTIAHPANVTCAVSQYDERALDVKMDGCFIGSIHFIRSYSVYQAQGSGICDRINTTAQEAFDKLVAAACK